MQILPYELAPELDQLYGHYVQELTPHPEIPTIEELIKMFQFCPYNGLAVRFLALRAAGAVGEYKNPEGGFTPFGTTTEEWVNSNFETMRGSMRQAIKKLVSQAICFGHGVGEIVCTANQRGYKEWRLWKIKILNPEKYTFAGQQGEWDRIIYNSSRKGRYPIPRRKLIHVYLPSIEEPDNPLGCGLSLRGYPYYKARQLALRSWNDQLLKNSRGLTLIKGDSSETVPQKDVLGNVLLDSSGKPMGQPALQHHVKEVAKAKEGSVIGLPKSYEFTHFPGTSGTGTDYNLALTRYSDDIFMAYGIPRTIFGEGSATLGQTGLNAGHRLVLDAQIEDLVEMLRSQILEMIVRPLLAANFGVEKEEQLGQFASSSFLSPQDESLQANMVSTGILQGIIEANDLAAINKYRKVCGLPPITAEEYNYQQMIKLEQAAAVEEETPDVSQ